MCDFYWSALWFEVLVVNNLREWIFWLLGVWRWIVLIFLVCWGCRIDYYMLCCVLVSENLVCCVLIFYSRDWFERWNSECESYRRICWEWCWWNCVFWICFCVLWWVMEMDDYFVCRVCVSCWCWYWFSRSAAAWVLNVCIDDFVGRCCLLVFCVWLILKNWELFIFVLKCIFLVFWDDYLLLLFFCVFCVCWKEFGRFVLLRLEL